MSAALVITALVGAVAVSAWEIRLRAAKAKVKEREADVKVLQSRNSVLTQDLRLAENLVRTLREEAQKHLETIRNCDDPAAIVELADQLLNDPWFGARRGD